MPWMSTSGDQTEQIKTDTDSEQVVADEQSPPSNPSDHTDRQEFYTVRLDMFQGPLDLLLYLIRRTEVDIVDIPLAEITDQYLLLLNQIEDIDVELAGEFLVMAATLIEIKSRTLMPPEDAEKSRSDEGGLVGVSDPSEADNPGYELIQQLLAYQRFRLAAENLEAGRKEFLKRYPNRPGKRSHQDQPIEPAALELEDLHVLDLSSSYENIMSAIDLNRLGDHHVEMDDTPIALYQEDLLDRLQRTERNSLTLQEVFAESGQPQRVGLFLATLELVRQRRVTVVQVDIESDIEVTLLDTPEEDLPATEEQTESTDQM